MRRCLGLEIHRFGPKMTAVFAVFLNGLLLTIAFAVMVTFVCVVWIFLHLALY